MPRELTPKQKHLAQQILAHKFDIPAAAEYCGYKVTSARTLASTERFKAYMNQIQQHSAMRLSIRADDLVQEIAALAYSDITEVLHCNIEDLQSLPRHVRAAIKKAKVRRWRNGDGDQCEEIELELHSKVEAQRLLAQILDPKPTLPDEGGAHKWTGLTVKTLPAPETAKLNGSE